MGKHGRRDREDRDGYGRGDVGDPRRMDGPAYYDAPRRLPRKLPIAVVLLRLLLWSLLAWVAFVLVDPLLGWVAASAGLLVDGGKGLATAAGAGKEVGAVIDSLDVSGLLGQVIALIRIVLKPAIVVFWAIGAVALIAAPVILAKLGGLLTGRRR